MRRGYLFSVLISIMLSMLLLFVQTQIVFVPTADIGWEVATSRNATLMKTAMDIDVDFPMSVTRSTYTLVEEAHSAGGLAALSADISTWDSFLGMFSDMADRNITSLELDTYNVSTYLGEGLLTLVNNDSEWHWSGNTFSLRHQGNRVLFNETMLDAINWDCSGFNSSGNVSVRVIVSDYDTGEKWIEYGNTYNCFVNFSEANHVDISFDESAQATMDCSSCPASFTHRVEWNTTDDRLYPVFGEENTTTAGTTNPGGWTEPDYPGGIGAVKHYGSGTYNFIVVDMDNDGEYDTVFVDVDADGDFTGNSDLGYIKTQSVADYGGKAFYTTVDLSGDWVGIQKALVVQTSGVKAVRL